MGNSHNNFDETELAGFASMASTWWDKNGDLKALHDINFLRLNYINARCPIAGKRVLDVGCGGGILSESLAAMGADVTGIDIAKEALAVAGLHLKTSGLHVNYERNPKSFLFAIVGAEYILGLVRKGTHTYRKFIKPVELEGWAIA